MKRILLLIVFLIILSVYFKALSAVANLRTVQSPSFVSPEQPFNITLSITNNGTDPIDAIEIEFLPKGGTAMFCSHTFDNSVSVGEEREFTLAGLICDMTGDEVYADLTLKSVNGEENYGSSAYMYVFCANEFVPRRVVVEEGASVDCGWCPRGYESMEYMRGKYSSDKWIGISYQQHGAMAATTTFASFWNRMAGRPFSYINRNYNYACSPYPEVFEDIMEQNANAPAIAEVTARMIDDNNIEVLIRFVLDYENADFRVAYILTEDNLGPYSQRNYYAGGANGTFMGWENKSSYESLIYNDIARPGSEYDGIAGLLPENISEGKTYSLILSPDLSYLTDRDNAHVSVLLVKGKDGIIANAAKIPLSQSDSAIPGIETDPEECDCIISAYGNSDIGIESRFSGTIADITGRIIALHSGHDYISLAAGLYIITCGSHCHKIVVH